MPVIEMVLIAFGFAGWVFYVVTLRQLFASQRLTQRSIDLSEKLITDLKKADETGHRLRVQVRELQALVRR